MGVITRAGKKGKHLHVKRDVPGWGTFRKAAGTTKKDAAKGYDLMVNQIGEAGGLDILNALRDDLISMKRCFMLWAGGSSAGVAAVRAEIAGHGKRPMAQRLIAPRIKPFLEKGSKHKDRRAGTNAGYETHLNRLVEELGGPTIANLGQ